MENVIIEIPEELKNWNDYIYAERSNRYWASTIKKQEALIVASHTDKIKYKGKYPVKIEVYKYFSSKRQDLDNVRLKGVFDGLVKAGVIENDNLNKIQEIILRPVFTKDKTGLKIIISPLEKE